MERVEWLGNKCLKDLHLILQKSQDSIILVLLYGSWTRKDLLTSAESVLSEALQDVTTGLVVARYAAMVQVDESDDTLEALIGDGDSSASRGKNPAPPMNMPCLAFFGQGQQK